MDENESLNRAEQLLESGETEEAQKLLDYVKQKSGRKYYLQGKLFMAENRYAEAYKQYKLAVKTEPDNEEYKRVFEDLDNFRKSEEYRLSQKGQMGGGEICAFGCCECCGSGACDAICSAVCDGCG